MPLDTTHSFVGFHLWEFRQKNWSMCACPEWCVNIICWSWFSSGGCVQHFLLHSLLLSLLSIKKRMNCRSVSLLPYLHLFAACFKHRGIVFVLLCFFFLFFCSSGNRWCTVTFCNVHLVAPPKRCHNVWTVKWAQRCGDGSLGFLIRTLLPWTVGHSAVVTVLLPSFYLVLSFVVSHLACRLGLVLLIKHCPSFGAL